MLFHINNLATCSNALKWATDVQRQAVIYMYQCEHVWFYFSMAASILPSSVSKNKTVLTLNTDYIK